MKILMIGGTGFLGPKVLQTFLQQGHEVAVFHRGQTVVDLPAGVRTIKGERSQLTLAKSEFSSFGPDVVLDLINSSQGQAQQLIEVCRGVTPHVVTLSSCDVYQAFDVFLGRSQDALQPVPLTETSALRHQFFLFKDMNVEQLPSWVDHFYEKIHAEEVVMNDPEIKGSILRLPMVYGPGDVQRRFGLIVKELQTSKEIVLDEETAQWQGCWGFIDNIVEAIRLVVTHPKAVGQIYHVADATNLTGIDIVQRLSEAANWQGEIRVTKEKHPKTNLRKVLRIETLNPAQYLCLDSSKIRQELGFQEPVSEKAAFQATYDYLVKGG